MGGIILDDLLAEFGSGALSLVLLREGAEKVVPLHGKAGSGLEVTLKYPRRLQSRLGRAGRALQWLRRRPAFAISAAAAVKVVARFAKEKGIQQIWAVLDSPLTIEVAARLVRLLGLPIYVTVWDDVEHNHHYFSVDGWSRRIVDVAYAGLIRESTSLAVIGESMRDAYFRRYGKRGVIVRHGLEIARREPEASVDLLRIGFAGSVTARSAFSTLLDALDGCHWRVAGRPVELVLLGPRFDLWSRGSRRISCLGYRSVVDTVEALGSCDFSYLPQPFEADWRPFAELSFPSKLTTYLAAGVPLLLHAPAYASLQVYNRSAGVALAVDSLDVGMLVAAMERLAGEDGLRQQLRAAAAQALANEFSSQHFKASFRAFLAA